MPVKACDKSATIMRDSRIYIRPIDSGADHGGSQDRLPRGMSRAIPAQRVEAQGCSSAGQPSRRTQ